MNRLNSVVNVHSVRFLETIKEETINNNEGNAWRNSVRHTESAGEYVAQAMEGTDPAQDC
jgi:hypothetical protein